MKIHPTAIIDPGAELHESVEIGPYTVIEKDVKIGEGSILESSIRIYSGTKIGKFNRIFHGAALGGIPQDTSFKPETKSYLEIGDNNIFRENCVFHRGSKEGAITKIGDSNFFMNQVHVGHDCQFADEIIVVPGTVVGGYSQVMRKAFLSGLVAVHQFVRIGEYAMIAGCAKLVKDIPPYSTADGNPASVIGLNTVGLKRAGFKPEIRDEIKKVYKLIYHSKLNTSQALAEIQKADFKSAEAKSIVKFFEESDRGVTAHREVGG
ncbi:MAG: acyl-ACP--UDP-N-acetylglucosamine O-acyltransferase [Leptospiraceae bacterium]|nr:acyl-ACP--UDP-N-acetylglucosamine O-acyltransferase [Leptospiraceae bacterium]MCK6381465.1 acyl-ACP--UDP-N-acetylglucosamine O-acyltransferase [Leptospiraceae bacterium]NUM40180.1 acyl-ACP--UDP-N-acetylglucosamine O-acyltransferase [Leptospiraceae bacterium]